MKSEGLTPPEDFCPGVKILLERMKTNPEEFELYGSGIRFSGFAHTMQRALTDPKELDTMQDWQCLRKEEQKALIEGYKELGRRRFSEGIMQQVLAEQEPDLGADLGIGVYAPINAPKPKKPKKIAINSAQWKLIEKLSQAEKDLYIKELEKWATGT